MAFMCLEMIRKFYYGDGKRVYQSGHMEGSTLGHIQDFFHHISSYIATVEYTEWLNTVSRIQEKGIESKSIEELARLPLEASKERGNRKIK